MADEAFLQVATIGGPADDAARSIEVIEGVNRVERIDGDPRKLVVAIQQGAREQVLREIGHVSGVIHAE